MENKYNILFVHLLNNYTGSPRVLANILKELSGKKEYGIGLLTSMSDGCLSDIKDITYYNNCYKWSDNRPMLLIRFLLSQLYMFFFILIKSKNIDLIYINTILPFMAALAGKLLKKKLIYHVHEIYLRPNIFQKIMWYIMENSTARIIAVSKYVSRKIKRNSVVIYNTVSREFEHAAKKQLEDKNDIVNYKFSKKNILMVSSLKKYKGVDIFISLAKKCPGYSFSLVLSSMQEEIGSYFSYVKMPDNINLISQKKDLLPYYLNATIVINLSMPDLWVETFGMTLIEGFQLGTPCIAPDFGGPQEIVVNGSNGFLIDPYDEDSIVAAIKDVLNSEKQYEKYFNNVINSKERYSIESTIRSIVNEIDCEISGNDVTV
jgi:glycosyltransferase involved in cell wall biosynthesis